jgi:hypothetical protein
MTPAAEATNTNLQWWLQLAVYIAVVVALATDTGNLRTFFASLIDAAIGEPELEATERQRRIRELHLDRRFPRKPPHLTAPRVNPYHLDQPAAEAATNKNGDDPLTPEQRQDERERWLAEEKAARARKTERARANRNRPRTDPAISGRDRPEPPDTKRPPGL